MKSTQSQSCPLCETDAAFYFVDFSERKYFKCPDCGKFQVTRRAELLLAKASANWREQLAMSAKQTPKEHLFVISVSLPTVGDSNRTTDAITSEYLPKIGLPL